MVSVIVMVCAIVIIGTVAGTARQDAFEGFWASLFTAMCGTIVVLLLSICTPNVVIETTDYPTYEVNGKICYEIDSDIREAKGQAIYENRKDVIVRYEQYDSYYFLKGSKSYIVIPIDKQ